MGESLDVSTFYMCIGIILIFCSRGNGGFVGFVFWGYGLGLYLGWWQ